jgi:transcriptional regulator with XRE-family HTH domain
MDKDKTDAQTSGEAAETSIGEQIRYWRNRVRISQMDLALDCDTSSRHLSFVETGRAHPSRALLLALIQYLEVPLRARNAMLISAGYAPIYEETGLSAPEMEQVRSMLNVMVQQNRLFPSMLIDRHWNILESNLAFDLMCETFSEDPALLQDQPLNLLRCFLNPTCLGNSVVNYEEMFDIMVNRAKRLISVRGNDPESTALLQEVLSYQPRQSRRLTDDLPQLVMPLKLRKGDLELNLFTMVATMGAPLNITLQEIHLEFGLPVDQASESLLREMIDKGHQQES